MSWNTYVQNLVDGRGATKAAIFGHNGSVWATSDNFPISQDEVSKFLAGFSNAEALRASGLFLCGEKYLVLRAEPEALYVKKGQGGAVLVKTAQAVLVGVYDSSIQPGQASQAVEKMGDYLREHGY